MSFVDSFIRFIKGANRERARERGVLYLPDCIDKMIIDYSRNVIAGDMEWEGKKFLTEGKVTDIYYGKIRILYKGSRSTFSPRDWNPLNVDFFDVVVVACYFDGDHNSELSKLKLDSTVVIEGESSSISKSEYSQRELHVSLRNCEIVEA